MINSPSSSAPISVQKSRWSHFQAIYTICRRIVTGNEICENQQLMYTRRTAACCPADGSIKGGGGGGASIDFFSSSHRQNVKYKWYYYVRSYLEAAAEDKHCPNHHQPARRKGEEKGKSMKMIRLWWGAYGPEYTQSSIDILIDRKEPRHCVSYLEAREILNQSQLVCNYLSVVIRPIWRPRAPASNKYQFFRNAKLSIVHPSTAHHRRLERAAKLFPFFHRVIICSVCLPCHSFICRRRSPA